MSLSRRSFLQASAAAAALGAVPALGRTAGDQMKIGLVTYLWGRDWDLETLLANCRAAGVLGVETRTTHAHGVEPELSAAQREEVRKKFADSGVTHVGPGSDERFDSPDPGVLAQAIARTKEFVLLSRDTGGSGVKAKPNDFHQGVPREKTIAQIAASLDEVGAFAADHGQEIRLEVHGQCAPPAIMRQIMDQVESPAVGVCWNSNDQDLEGAGLDENFAMLKDRFGATLHVRELNIGDYPYGRLMELLVEMNYGGWVLLECRTDPADRVAAMREQREVFQDLIAAAQADV